MKVNHKHYREILAPHVWDSPDSDYVIASQNRDSDALTRSNYRRIFADLQACAKLHESDADESTVYDFRAGHLACGWVEYIIVAHDAPESVLVAAAKILCALENYPVYL